MNILNKPIVFLDMDGVMNNHHTYMRAFRYRVYPPGNSLGMSVCKAAVMRLKKLVEITNSDIVISSSWRSFTIDDLSFSKHGNGAVLNALQWGGFKNCKDFIIGNTIHLPYKNIRGDEIEHWLINHPNRYKKDITPVIILDDDADFLLYQLEKHLIKTETKTGFTLERLNKAIEVLHSLKTTY